MMSYEEKKFNYVLLEAYLRNSSTMKNYTISSEISGDSSIESIRLTKILEISDDFMYFLMEGYEKTSVFKLNLTAPNEL